VAFSPDSKRLASATASQNRGVQVWDAQTGQQLLTFMGMGHASSVVFSPDGTRLASGAAFESVRIWDATTSQEARTFSGPPGRYRSVAFSPDGKRLAFGSGTWDETKNAYVAGEVKVWEAQTGQEVLALKGHTDEVRSVAFSPDGKRLASGSWGTWDETKKAYVGGEVKVWEAQTGQELLTCEGGGIDVAFSPDGKRLTCASGDKTVKVWDAQTGQELLTLKGHTGRVRSVVFSPDSTRIASASGGYEPPKGPIGEVKVWDAQTGQELLNLKGATGGDTASVAFSPDGKRLASGSQWVKVWDAQTGQELLTFMGHASSVAFSPDGKRLASASEDKTVKVWDAQAGQELLSLKGGGNRVIFSPDGKRLASNSPMGDALTIWDATPLLEKP
jgi:WD40 repeat protein